jgi:hypothetical protein
VIRVADLNESEVDNSDFVSEKSDHEGWLHEKDRRHEERRRNNKLVWKIMDAEEEKKS